jgi:hypothetical protein
LAPRIPFTDAVGREFIDPKARPLAAPVPDLDAFAVKVALAADHEAVTPNGCESCLLG